MRKDGTNFQVRINLWDLYPQFVGKRMSLLKLSLAVCFSFHGPTLEHADFFQGKDIPYAWKSCSPGRPVRTPVTIIARIVKKCTMIYMK